MNTTTSIVSKVWNFCHTLRDDGVSYGEYLEQLTYLLFLKMADEYAKPPYNRKSNIPKEYNWESLRAKRGAELEAHYVTLLRELGQKSGMLGQIFFKAQNRIQDPAKLYKIIDMIDRENWVTMGADVKGEIYEGLLEKNAEDVKSGAGQYFTPRPLIRVMVECLRPEPMKTIADPACGTGGFFLAAYDFLTNHHGLNQDEKKFLKFKTFRGWEIVPDTYRLCLMNLFLHNVGDMESEPPITRNDSLIADNGTRFDYVMTNPPFGKKSSMTFTGSVKSFMKKRRDLWRSLGDENGSERC
jgi:type I restriction enzyme M protein